MKALHMALLDDALDAFHPRGSALAGGAVYVNGASGFLASNLLLFLSELNRRESLGLRLFASARRPMAQVPLFRFMDVSPEVDWEIATAQQAKVPQVNGLIAVHTASYGSPRDYLREPLETMDANTRGMARLFEGPRPPAHVVYFSSAEIYGQPPEQAIPTPETFVGGSDLLSPRCIYGESKRLTEALGVTLAARDRVPLTVLRPWNIYGPGQRLEDGRIPMEFLRQALSDGHVRLAGDGSPTRCLCHAWDGVPQIAAALVPEPDKPVRVFNVGNSTVESPVSEIARACATAAGLGMRDVSLGAPAGNTGPVRCVPDTGRMTALLGGAPTVPLGRGLPATIEWCRYLLATKDGK